MAKITITKENLLTLDEFKTLLEGTTKRSSAVDDLLSLLRELVAYEEQYALRSDVFYARFMRGEMGDDLDFIMWAGQYELYLETKQAIDSQLLKIPVAV